MLDSGKKEDPPITNTKRSTFGIVHQSTPRKRARARPSTFLADKFNMSIQTPQSYNVELTLMQRNDYFGSFVK